MRVTGGNCTLPAIRIWQTTPLTAPRQRLIHTNPRSAACAISAAQDYHPNVWSNSSSGISSASTPALCNNRSCRASALRFAVWSKSSSGIASNTASGAASSCPIFISSGGERAEMIAGALVGSPSCSSICRTVAGSVINSGLCGVKQPRCLNFPKGEKNRGDCRGTGWITNVFKYLPHGRWLCNEPNQAHLPTHPLHLSANTP